MASRKKGKQTKKNIYNILAIRTLQIFWKPFLFPASGNVVSVRPQSSPFFSDTAKGR